MSVWVGVGIYFCLWKACRVLPAKCCKARSITSLPFPPYSIPLARKSTPWHRLCRAPQRRWSTGLPPVAGEPFNTCSKSVTNMRRRCANVRPDRRAPSHSHSAPCVFSCAARLVENLGDVVVATVPARSLESLFPRLRVVACRHEKYAPPASCCIPCCARGPTHDLCVCLLLFVRL